MKKLITLISALLLCLGALGQTTVTAPSQNLKLQLKNAAVVGNDVELTFVVSNTSAKETVINLVGGIYQTGMAGSIAYDNEGNVYELSDILVSVGNKSYTDQYSAGSFPANVPVKCHLLVKGMAKEAKSLTKVKLCLLAPELNVASAGACFEINNVSFR